MSIDGTNLEFVKPLKVRVDGSWQESRMRDWKGIAISTEPLVALVLLRFENKVEWCKSERGNPDGQPVRLLLSPYDSEKLDVQINFSVGGGHVRSRSIVSSDTYKPKLLELNNISTGVFYKMFDVKGSRNIELYSLFLAASDVKVGRNGLWHIRKEHQENVEEPLARILSFGRNGEYNT